MRRNKIIEEIEMAQMEREVPDFSPGDTITVQVRVREGSRERLQAFEGVVIGKRSRGLNSSFIVRKISHGVGVERTFQTYSPLIAEIEVKRKEVMGTAAVTEKNEQIGVSYTTGGMTFKVSQVDVSNYDYNTALSGEHLEVALSFAF